MGQVSFDLSLTVPRHLVREYLIVSHTEPRFTAPVGPMLQRVPKDSCRRGDDQSILEIQHTSGVTITCHLAPASDAKTKITLTSRWSPIALDSTPHRQAIVDLAMRLYGMEYGYITGVTRSTSYRRIP